MVETYKAQKIDPAVILKMLGMVSELLGVDPDGEVDKNGD